MNRIFRPIFLTFYHLIILVLGVILVAIPIVHKYKTNDLHNYSEELGYPVNLNSINVLGYVLPKYITYSIVTAGIALIISSLYGFYGLAMKSNKIFSALLTLIEILFFGSLILYGYNKKIFEYTEEKYQFNVDQYVNDFKGNIRENFEKYYVKHKNELDNFMKLWRCCGINGPKDFVNSSTVEYEQIFLNCQLENPKSLNLTEQIKQFDNTITTPTTTTKKIVHEIFNKGCLKVVSDYYSNYIGFIGCIGVVLSIVAMCNELKK